MFTDDEDEGGSRDVIPGTPSDSDDDIGKISTPMVSKKNFKLHLKDFDMSVVESASAGAANMNQTVVSAPILSDTQKRDQAKRDRTVPLLGSPSPADFQKRRVPRIEYSSDDDSDSHGSAKQQQQKKIVSRPNSKSKSSANSGTGAGFESLHTIAGTPSTTSVHEPRSRGSGSSGSMSSFEFEQESGPKAGSSKSKSLPKKSSSHHLQSRRPTSANNNNDNSTLLIDDLAEQVSQIGLGLVGRPSQSNRGENLPGAVGGAPPIDDDLAALGRQLQDSSIQEVSAQIKRPPMVIEVDDDSVEEVEVVDSRAIRDELTVDRHDGQVYNQGEGQRPLASQVQRQAQQQQNQRKLIYLPDALPMGPSSEPHQVMPKIPPHIAEEMRGTLGSTIHTLQKIISSIPKEDDVDPLGKPNLLRTELYSHQKYGLLWLWWREQCKPYGGILADEMGLGKTVMILALICRGKTEGAKENNPSDWRSTENKRLVPSRGTLVVCPASVMGQWESEVTKKARGLRVLVYHGQTRTKSSSVLAQYDVVITTYNTLGSEIPKLSEQTAEACRSPALRVSWLRVVLDEGHVIRNSKTASSQAACRLTAQHRWVVTGTPVHNQPADMYTLVKFLRLVPFDDPKVWDAWIGMKVVTSQNAGRLHTIGKSLLLRRTKDEVMAAQLVESLAGASIESIPSKTIHDIFVDLKEDEKEIYEHLNTFATAEFRAFLKSKQQRTNELQLAADRFVAGRPRPPRAMEEKSFTHIFTLILRLRQCAVLPHLIRTMIEEDDSVNADVSFDPIEDLISMKNPCFSEQFQSAKLDKMYEDLATLKRECRSRGERMEKVVIVSQWTSLLRIVEMHLKEQGYSLTTISGEVKIRDRTDIMGKFNADPKRPQIMLLSLAAGGVGLNLVGANHLFFLDIHWNPQLELQAQDRIHRFGQKKPVSIYRYISRGTIEERVVALQKLKLELADGILNNAQKKTGGGLNVQEMRQLFGI